MLGTFGGAEPALDSTVPRVSFLLLPTSIILPKVNKHGDSTTQDRGSVSDGYTARHYCD